MVERISVSALWGDCNPAEWQPIATNLAQSFNPVCFGHFFGFCFVTEDIPITHHSGLHLLGLHDSQQTPTYFGHLEVLES